MSKISVVLAGLLDTVSTADFIVPILRNSLVSEIVLCVDPVVFENDHLAQELEELIARHGEKFKPVIAGSTVNNAALLNQAVAAASEQTVLILERPVLVGEVDLTAAIDELSLDPRAIIKFECRALKASDLNLPSFPYYESVPENAGVRNGAYMLNRTYFLELRGFDERGEASSFLGMELLHRHVSRGGRTIIPEKNLSTVYSLPGIDDFTGMPSYSSEAFRKYLLANRSIYRNLIDWSVPAELRVPLVSVAIATKDRADLLAESIASVLYQSFQDFEIIVVDDGSENPAAVEKVVKNFKDERIRLFRNPKSQGVSYARNRAADESKCILTAVHDDDDLMLPHRLMWGIEALTDSADASYGAWTNFDDKDGSMRTFLTKHGFGSSLVAFNGSGPGHSTWTLPTKIIKALRYNESLTSAVDHYFATRSAMAGVRWVHVQKVMYLRRVHDLQITSQDADRQKSGHLLSKISNRFLASPHGYSEMQAEGKSLLFPTVAGARDPQGVFLGFLPDHLVDRDVVVKDNVANTLMNADFPAQMVSIMEDRDSQTGQLFAEHALLRSMSLRDLVDLRKSGSTKWEVVGRIKDTSPISPQKVDVQDEENALIEAHEKVKQQAMDRLQVVYSSLRKKSHQGQLVVLWQDEVSDFHIHDVEVAGITLHRRVIVKGEFGITICLYLIGFKDFPSAFKWCKSMDDTSLSRNPIIYPGIELSDFVNELLTVRKEVFIEHSLDDSGLGR